MEIHEEYPIDKGHRMPGAIADASTLINLASVDHLELLREFHGKITVPPAVNGTECELYGKMAKWNEGRRDDQVYN